MKEASRKRHMTHHNVAVLRKSRDRKAFGKDISNHEVRATIMNTHMDVSGTADVMKLMPLHTYLMVLSQVFHACSLLSQVSHGDNNEHEYRCVGKICGAQEPLVRLVKQFSTSTTFYMMWDLHNFPLLMSMKKTAHHST